MAFSGSGGGCRENLTQPDFQNRQGPNNGRGINTGGTLMALHKKTRQAHKCIKGVHEKGFYGEKIEVEMGQCSLRCGAGCSTRASVNQPHQGRAGSGNQIALKRGFVDIFPKPAFSPCAPSLLHVFRGALIVKDFFLARFH